MNKPPETAGAANAEPLLRVERYAGHRADTEPQRVHLGACSVAVNAIFDSSLAPAIATSRSASATGASTFFATTRLVTGGS